MSKITQVSTTEKGCYAIDTEGNLWHGEFEYISHTTQVVVQNPTDKPPQVFVWTKLPPLPNQ